MFHPTFVEKTAGLPPSILAQAVSRATRALSCSIPELAEVSIEDPRGQKVTDLLDKVVKTDISIKKNVTISGFLDIVISPQPQPRSTPNFHQLRKYLLTSKSD
jgi:hypothetical protein